MGCPKDSSLSCQKFVPVGAGYSNEGIKEGYPPKNVILSLLAHVL